MTRTNSFSLGFVIAALTQKKVFAWICHSLAYKSLLGQTKRIFLKGCWKNNKTWYKAFIACFQVKIFLFLFELWTENTTVWIQNNNTLVWLYFSSSIDSPRVFLFVLKIRVCGRCQDIRRRGRKCFIPCFARIFLQQQQFLKTPKPFFGWNQTKKGSPITE